MKRIVSMVILAAMSLSLFACGGKNEISNDDVVDTTLNAKNELVRVYNACCDYKASAHFLKLSSDRMSMTIDTKPDDTYFKYEDKAIAAISTANAGLGIPSAVMEKMSMTKALDGIQSQNCGDFTVTWTYHPDNGLEVIYEVNIR